jgi:hypothetical protein
MGDIMRYVVLLALLLSMNLFAGGPEDAKAVKFVTDVANNVQDALKDQKKFAGAIKIQEIVAMLSDLQTNVLVKKLGQFFITSRKIVPTKAGNFKEKPEELAGEIQSWLAEKNWVVSKERCPSSGSGALQLGSLGTCPVDFYNKIIALSAAYRK